MTGDGGWMMYPILAFGVLGIPFAVVLVWVFGFMRWRAPASLSWALLTACAGCGILANGLASWSISAGLNSVEPSSAQALLAHHVSTSMFSNSAWMFACGVGFMLVGWAACIPAVVTPGPSSAVDPVGAGASVLGALLGVSISVVVYLLTVGGQAGDVGPALFVVPTVAVISTFAGVIACLRRSDDPLYGGRTPAWRGMMGMCFLLGVILLGSFFTQQGKVLTFMAVANASANARQDMLVMGLDLSVLAQWVGTAAALPATLACWFGALPHLGRLTRRELIGGVVATLQALLIVGALIAAAVLDPWRFFM